MYGNGRRPTLVNMVVADALMPNRRQAIGDQHTDWPKLVQANKKENRNLELMALCEGKPIFFTNCKWGKNVWISWRRHASLFQVTWERPEPIWEDVYVTYVTSSFIGWDHFHVARDNRSKTCLGIILCNIRIHKSQYIVVDNSRYEGPGIKFTFEIVYSLGLHIDNICLLRSVWKITFIIL